MPLNLITDGVWEAREVLRMPPAIHFPIRMTVLRTGPRGLALVSPIPIEDALAKEIDAIGDVEFVIAPNLLHHLYAGAAKARWPRARLCAPAGLAQKRPDLAIDQPLSAGLLSDDLAVFPTDGAPKLGEHGILHRPSRTLVLTDLVFNIQSAPNLATRFVFRWISRVYGVLAQSALIRFYIDDRAAMKASVDRMLSADFDRLVVAHGEIVEDGARAKLSAALAPRHR